MADITRRELLGLSIPAALTVALGFGKIRGEAQDNSPKKLGEPEIGLVTYLIAAEWDVPTIIRNCSEAQFKAVELRTTHAHGVEVSLSSAERKNVRAMFDNSPVRLASLGSAFEYDNPDPAILRENIEGTKKYAELAADLGCDGIKVRPNRLHEDKGIAREKTIEQIAAGLTEVGNAAADQGVEIRVEVHGQDTSRFPVFNAIMERCESPNVYVNWNSNDDDLLDGGLEHNFKLVADKIRFVHMRDMFLESYPWRKLLTSLRQNGYNGYCCAEIPASSDPLLVMKYYRALFLAYQDRL